jgi:hypothetical protein
MAKQISRGVKLGVASSVTGQEWEAAQIYPVAANRALSVWPSHADLLKLFAPG